VLAHVVDNALAADLSEVILVLGHEAERIRAVLGDRLGAVSIVVNPDHAAGQSTSLRAGLTAVSSESAAVLVLLGDQPRVGRDVIESLVAAFRETRAPIVMPTYGGVPANPVLFTRSLFPEILAVAGDQGARELVRAHRAETHLVPFPDRDPPLDVDTEEDYLALLAQRSNGS
jgi:molybdenum cofactor cytidylyltransferase